MIIPGQFGFNYPSGFREEAFWNIFKKMVVILFYRFLYRTYVITENIILKIISPVIIIWYENLTKYQLSNLLDKISLIEDSTLANQ